MAGAKKANAKIRKRLWKLPSSIARAAAGSLDTNKRTTKSVAQLVTIRENRMVGFGFNPPPWLMPAWAKQ